VERVNALASTLLYSELRLASTPIEEKTQSNPAGKCLLCPSHLPNFSPSSPLPPSSFDLCPHLLKTTRILWFTHGIFSQRKEMLYFAVLLIAGDSA
jgi:hypothetical protein